MRKKLFKALLMISILSTSLIHRPPAQASWDSLSGDFISGLSKLDPTNRDSKLRELGREFDPTKPGGKLEDVKKAAFEVRYCLVKGGCDITRPEVQQIVKQELENCFVKGGCDLSIPAFREKGLEYVKKARATYNSFPSAIIDVFKSAVGMVDTLFLEGFISRNFGHVTNKFELQKELESKGVVIYGHEINHEDYESATLASAASITTSNPGPLINNLLNLAKTISTKMIENSRDAVKNSKSILKEKYANQLEKLDSSIKKITDPEFIAKSLAEYILTGKTPEVPKLEGNLSKLSIRLGVLSYNRAEKFLTKTIPTPNTHQPYILITLPELTVEVNNILSQKTKQYDEILNEDTLTNIVFHLGNFIRSTADPYYTNPYHEKEREYFDVFTQARNEKNVATPATSSWKHSVLTYEDTRFGGQGKFTIKKDGNLKKFSKSIKKSLKLKVELDSTRFGPSTFNVIEVKPEYITIQQSLGSDYYYIRLYDSGYIEYTTGKNMSENAWSQWGEGKWDIPPTPPACLERYDPSKYRPGTPGWTGKTAKIAFNNSLKTSLQVRLYHPDSPDRVFKNWTVEPGQNIFLDQNTYGMDWGIQVTDSPVCIVGKVSAWKQVNGEYIFQSKFPFKALN
jgi:hypothetical protein